MEDRTLRGVAATAIILATFILSISIYNLKSPTIQSTAITNTCNQEMKKVLPQITSLNEKIKFTSDQKQSSLGKARDETISELQKNIDYIVKISPVNGCSEIKIQLQDDTTKILITSLIAYLAFIFSLLYVFRIAATRS